MAEPVDGASAPSTPVTLAPQGDGRFAGTVTVAADGEWRVRVTAVEPPGTVEVIQAVAAEVAESTTTTGLASASPTSAPASERSTATAAVPRASTARSGGAGVPVLAWVLGHVVLIGLVGAVLLRRGAGTGTK